MNDEILRLIREKGLLLEKEVFDLVNSLSDAETARDFLERAERCTGQKIITRAAIEKNSEFMQKMAWNLTDKQSIERVFIKLGISFEAEKIIFSEQAQNSDRGVLDIKKEIEIKEKNKEADLKGVKYQVFYADTKPDKKLEVKDFIGNFKSRYQQLQRILMQRADLTNLVTINKISMDRRQLSIIGLVKEKRMTKNKNLIVTLEDFTGEINILVKGDREGAFAAAQELQLDDVVAVKGSGNRDIIFTTNIYYPDAFIYEKARIDKDISVAFLSDVHCGSDRHLGKSMEKFLEWINGEDETAKKIEFIFFVGDNVDGVGIFPGQEKVLELKSMKEQYRLLASYIRRIPKRITMFMCPGQHDAARVAEPQPLIDRTYAEQLYDIENLIMVTNPSLVKITEGQKEFKILMYHGASIHNFINEIPELREMKAHRTPAKAVGHMLKRRHLAPTHSSAVYIPNYDKDPLVISEVPDVLCTGEVHRPDIENYNGVLIITGSCWQAQTPFEEQVGNIPDPGKVPILNLKTRELKIYDFLVEEEIKRWFMK